MSQERVGFNFSGTRVLVTGGSNGIGLGVARGFAEAGAEVTITGTQKTGSDYDHDLSDFDYRSVDMRNGEELDALIASYLLLLMMQLPNLSLCDSHLLLLLQLKILV